ncbi:MAG: hypothetical protein RO469_15845 [Thermincola sp.]|jgi:uncharacterized protein YabE (DUF348 family)|nr:hypothetical protein [Thermincola sp.]MDT3704318.1 hypothetical protein [Thermincola sp.]
MRDRTIILLALLFLISTVGIGVNKSLAAGNKMLGRQMAPTVDEIYKQQGAPLLSAAKDIAAYSKAKGLAIAEQYPVLVRQAKALTVRLTKQISTLITDWRGKLSSHITQKVIYY